MTINYNNLYTHFFLINENRYPFVKEKYRNKIERYITDIIYDTDSKLYEKYANPEDVRSLVSRDPKISKAKLTFRVIGSIKRFIKLGRLIPGNFSWQQPGSAFSVSKFNMDRVCKSILTQPLHPKKLTFKKEFEKCTHFYQQTLKWEIR